MGKSDISSYHCFHINTHSSWDKTEFLHIPFLHGYLHICGIKWAHAYTVVFLWKLAHSTPTCLCSTNLDILCEYFWSYVPSAMTQSIVRWTIHVSDFKYDKTMILEINQVQGRRASIGLNAAIIVSRWTRIFYHFFNISDTARKWDHCASNKKI